MNKKVLPGRVIIQVGVPPLEKHELETANFLAAMGKEVVFIKPHFVVGQKNPDVQMDGKIWELKSPCGKGKGTLERIYRRAAAAQSENIVFDLRRMNIDEKVAVSKIKQQFNCRRGKVRRIMIITKNNQPLDLFR